MSKLHLLSLLGCWLSGILVGLILATASTTSAAPRYELQGFDWAAKELMAIKKSAASSTKAQWAQVYWAKRQALAMEQSDDKKAIEHLRNKAVRLFKAGKDLEAIDLRIQVERLANQL